MITQRAVLRSHPPSRRTSRFMRHTLPAIVSYLVLILVGLCFFVPFLWLIITSLKPLGQVFTMPLTWIPHPIMWSNYPKALTHPGFPFLQAYAEQPVLCRLLDDRSDHRQRHGRLCLRAHRLPRAQPAVRHHPGRR